MAPVTGRARGQRWRVLLATTSIAAGLGEAAALGAASCWVVTAMAFAAAGRRIGSATVNLLRILAATVLLAIIARVTSGAWIPDVPSRSLGLLVLSGMIGLALGDQLLFAALVRIGPRLATLVATTLTPPLTVAIAWPLLDERPAPVQALGMALIIGGIAWSILDRRGPSDRDEGDGAAPAPARGRALAGGLLLAAGGGICQAIGLVTSKLGLGHGPGATPVDDVDPWVATFIRMAAAVPAAALLTGLVLRRGGRPAWPAAGPERRRVWLALAAGTVFGPVLGVWLSLVAVDNTDTGIAATLLATTPILILPFAVWIDRERLGVGAIAGAIIAVAGVAILSLAAG